MANEWPEKALGDVIDIKHGFAFKGEYFRDEPMGDILLTPGNFALGGGFKADKIKYYDGPVPDEFVLREGDLIVTMTDLSKDSDTLGFSAIVPPNNQGRRYLHNQRIGKVVAREEGVVDLRYLHYMMCSRPYRTEIVASATGTTVKHTSPERIMQFRFRLPTVIEQRAIAHILGTLDAKTEINRRMNETLEAMARALFKSWFVDFDPVRAKMEGRDTGLPQHIADLFPSRLVDSELGEIPEGWEIEPLYELATYINGAAYAAFEPNEKRRGLPIIKIAELKAGVTSQTKFSDVQMPDKYRIARGDILFSWSGNPDTSIDTFVWVHSPAWLNQHIFKVVPHRSHERSFLLTLLKQLRPTFAEIARNKQTTGLGHVTAADMKQLMVVFPNDALLRAWDLLAAPIVNRAFLNEIETDSLTALRDAVLPRLISGEVRVKCHPRLAELRT